jgi:CHASE2 domain-containing sensor protein
MKIIVWLRKQLKGLFDSIRNEHLKKNALRAIPCWIAAIIVGLMAVGYTKLLFTQKKSPQLYLTGISITFLYLPRSVLFLHGGWSIALRPILAAVVSRR